MSIYRIAVFITTVAFGLTALSLCDVGGFSRILLALSGMVLATGSIAAMYRFFGTIDDRQGRAERSVADQVWQELLK